MKKHKVKLIVVLFFVSIYIFRNFFTVWMVTGKYSNTNYENCILAETPNRADTLILFGDMTYESSYFGKGTYSLSYNFGGTNIIWSQGSNGAAGHHTGMQRNWFGNLQINLDRDLNQFYSKFE